jgi:Ca2+-binding RTX toxin-like protein
MAINGTPGNNSLTGGSGNDVLNGLGGNDTLNGGAGADTMDGGSGNDTFIVDNLLDTILESPIAADGLAGGIDTIKTSVLDPLGTYSLERFAYVENLTYTGTLAATLKGNAQSNVLQSNSAQSKADTIWGGAGDDTIKSFGGSDSLMGDAGNDLLDGGTGADTLIGGNGNDLFLVDATGDRVYEYGGSSSGIDTIEGAVVKSLALQWTRWVEGLTYTGTTVATLQGNALDNVIVSRSATNDTLNGGDGDDTLDGGNGTDSMVGGLGDDVYRVSTTDVVKELVGEGIDTFVGARTSINVSPYSTTIENLFYTGSTASTVSGNAMNNLVGGGSGKDTVNGLDGNDTLAGGGGADSVVGGGGNDLLYGGGIDTTFLYIPGAYSLSSVLPDTAVDTLAGGAGDDTYRIDALNDVVSEASGAGFDVVESTIDNSLARYANVEGMRLSTSSAAWRADGSTRADILVGNYTSNYLAGAAGNDTISGGLGYSFSYGLVSDVLDGGDGNDALVAFGFGSFYSSYAEISMFGGAGNDLYVLGEYTDIYGGFDSGGTDTAVGFGTSTTLELLEGVEHLALYGSGRPEDAAARSAIDAVNRVAVGTAYGGTLGTAINGRGSDLPNKIWGNANGNRLEGLAGNDTLDGGAGNDTLDGGAGNDSMIGGTGNDTYVVQGSDVIVEAPDGGTLDLVQSATATSYAAFANIEGLIYTGTANVNLTNGPGNISNDYFFAGSGKDTLKGEGGNDTLNGGGGNDSIEGGAGNDNLAGGDGNDTIRGGTENDVMDGGAGNDSFFGDAGNDNQSGGEGDDVLRGGTENDSLNGGAGNDSAIGEAGSDTLDGEAGNDTLSGGDDNDTIYGADGADSILGGAGNDVLYGFESYDYGYLPYTETTGNKIFGEDGNDQLWGSSGNDSLAGGAGADVMVGRAGNDTLEAGTPLVPTGAFSTAADQMWGDDQFGSGTVGNDVFRFVGGSGAIETSPGNGQWYFSVGSLVADFQSGSDKLAIDNVIVGDGDATLEGVVTHTSGDFDKDAELVVFTANASATFSFGTSMASFLASAVTTVIGSADASFAVGNERIFVVDNGTSSAVFAFEADNADAAVTVEELSLIAVVVNNSALAASDFVLF